MAPRLRTANPRDLVCDFFVVCLVRLAFVASYISHTNPFSVLNPSNTYQSVLFGDEAPTFPPTEPPTLLPTPSPVELTPSPTTLAPVELLSEFPSSFAPSDFPSLFYDKNIGTDDAVESIETIVPDEISASPSDAPSSPPTTTPSAAPSDSPSSTPSDAPSSVPSDVPSDMPSLAPSDMPSDMPSLAPSSAPSPAPVIVLGPTVPTRAPVISLTLAPVQVFFLDEEAIKVFEDVCAKVFLPDFIPWIYSADYTDLTCEVLEQVHLGRQLRRRSQEVQTAELSYFINGVSVFYRVTSTVVLSEGLVFSDIVKQTFETFSGEFREDLEEASDFFLPQNSVEEPVPITDQEEGGSKTRNGAIIGGSLAVGAVLALTVAFLIARHRNRDEEEELPHFIDDDELMDPDEESSPIGLKEAPSEIMPPTPMSLAPIDTNTPNSSVPSGPGTPRPPPIDVSADLDLLAPLALSGRSARSNKTPRSNKSERSSRSRRSSTKSTNAKSPRYFKSPRSTRSQQSEKEIPETPLTPTEYVQSPSSTTNVVSPTTAIMNNLSSQSGRQVNGDSPAMSGTDPSSNVFFANNDKFTCCPEDTESLDEVMDGTPSIETLDEIMDAAPSIESSVHLNVEDKLEEPKILRDYKEQKRMEVLLEEAAAAPDDEIKRDSTEKAAPLVSTPRSKVSFKSSDVEVELDTNSSEDRYNEIADLKQRKSGWKNFLSNITRSALSKRSKEDVPRLQDQEDYESEAGSIGNDVKNKEITVSAGLQRPFSWDGSFTESGFDPVTFEENDDLNHVLTDLDKSHVLSDLDKWAKKSNAATPKQGNTSTQTPRKF